MISEHITPREVIRHDIRLNSPQEVIRHDIRLNSPQEVIRHDIRLNSPQEVIRHDIRLNSPQEIIRHDIRLNSPQEVIRHDIRTYSPQRRYPIAESLISVYIFIQFLTIKIQNRLWSIDIINSNANVYYDTAVMVKKCADKNCQSDL